MPGAGDPVGNLVQNFARLVANGVWNPSGLPTVLHPSSTMSCKNWQFVSAAFVIYIDELNQIGFLHGSGLKNAANTCKHH